jgi:hypothetical protein
MPPRTTPRLANCEYVIPERDGSVTLFLARLELMCTVRRVYPTMLKRLSEEVFPSFADLANSGFDFDAALSHPGYSPLSMFPESGLTSALLKWAKDFHAERDWLLDDALRALRGWHVAPDWRQSLRWNPIGGGTNTLAVGGRFLFELQGWEMQLLTWADYRQFARKEFDRKLGEYEAACRKLAESRGMVRVPRKYKPTHLDWFVLYQFGGLPAAEITRRDGSYKSTDESTVPKGIKSAAKLVGWGRLRPRKGTANRNIR